MTPHHRRIVIFVAIIHGFEIIAIAPGFFIFYCLTGLLIIEYALEKLRRQK